LEVHFKVWDVDDPFDQLHGPGSDDEIVGVELVDDDQVGGETAPFTDSDDTDETGRAEVMVTVSMQPTILLLPRSSTTISSAGSPL